MSNTKLFINGNLINHKTKDAFLTENGIITKTGKASDLLTEYEHTAEVIDLNNQFITPAFNDGHLHYFYYSLLKESIDLKNCNSLEEVYNKIKSQAAKSDEHNWITVINWDEEQFGGVNKLDRYVLDRLSKNIPILVKRRCLHLAFVNSRALEIANIDKDTPDPAGGKIVRDQEGYPTGELQDESIGIIDDIVLEKQRTRFKEILKNSAKDFLKNGITSIHTDDLGHKKYREDIFQSYYELASDKELPLDITLQMRVTEQDDFDYYQKIREQTKELTSLKTGPVKFMFDGSLGGRTAALRKHYTDDTTTKGELLFEKDHLEELIDTAYQLDFQPAVHAIGIKAVEIVSKIYEKMNKKYPDKNLRPIIVHASMLDDKLIERVQKNNIVLSIQPTFISSDYKMADKRLGKRRSKSLYRMRSLLEKGITLAGSSDAPVEDIDPLFGIYAAVKRKQPNQPHEKSWHPNEIIDINKALQLYTTGPAYQNFKENLKGKLKEGYKADFITFNKNPLNIKSEEIVNLKVREVYRNSNLVYTN